MDPALRDRVRELTLPERLELISELWQSIETDQIQVTAADRDLLDERVADLRDRPEAGRPWDEIEAELRSWR